MQIKENKETIPNLFIRGKYKMLLTIFYSNKVSTTTQKYCNNLIIFFEVWKTKSDKKTAFFVCTMCHQLTSLLRDQLQMSA